MILFADSQASSLVPVLKSLAVDPHWKVGGHAVLCVHKAGHMTFSFLNCQVRQVIACGIHEVVPQLTRSQITCKAVMKEYIGLLKDKHPEVGLCAAVGPHAAVVLAHDYYICRLSSPGANGTQF